MTTLDTSGNVMCDECGGRDCPLLEIGTGEDYRRGTANLCEACLRKALAFITDPARIAEADERERQKQAERDEWERQRVARVAAANVQKKEGF